MFMHLSWRRKNKEKKEKGKEKQGQWGVRSGCGAVGFAVGSACSELGRKSESTSTEEGGGGLIWNNPAFRRLYAWRLWLMCL